MPDILGTNLTTSTLLTTGALGTPDASIDFAGDRDWWKVTLSANTTYQFRLNSASGSLLRDPYLALYSPTASLNTLVTFDDDGGDGVNALINYTATVAGDYFLSAQGYGSQTGVYEISATVTSTADSVGGTIGTATALVLGTPTGGAGSWINTPGDLDYYSIALTEGTTYRFSMTSAGATADPFLRLIGPTRTIPTPSQLDDPSVTMTVNDIVAMDDDSGDGSNALITYTVPTGGTGTYYVSAEGWDGNTGAYVLSASTYTPTVDAVAATTGGAVVVTVGGAATNGTIDAVGDQDYYRVAVTVGTTYDFTLNGTTLADPFLRLMDGSGVLITTNDDGGTGLNSLLTYTAAATGNVFLSAEGYGTSTGTFAISATSRGTLTDVVGNNTSTTNLAVAGGSVNSTIATVNDQDWFRVTLVADTTYKFQMNGTTLADPYLRLMDSAGTMITYDDDSGAGWNAQIIYKATVGGTYYLAAQGFGNETGDYTVTSVIV